MTPTLFVYGTLKRRAPSSPHRLLRSARFASRASMRGRLYDLGEYPGLVRGQAGGHRVFGELYELPPDTAIETLRALDQYEGRAFSRERVYVTLPSGRRRAAWTYVLRRAPRSAPTLASGRYTRRRGAA